jgi:hypothetical protein
MTDRAWKRAERQIAKRLGGKRTGNAGRWQCRKCKEALGYVTPQGRVWLDMDQCKVMERFWNLIRVQCVCGQVNRWGLRGSDRKRGPALDDQEESV